MDVASPKRGGRRPKAPDVDFSGAEAKVSVADGAVASSPSPDVVADGAVASSPSPDVVADDVDHSFSRDTSQDTDPVSISDLEAVFQPGHAPPLWSGSTDPAMPATSVTTATSVTSEPVAPSDREVSSSASPRASESAAASLRRMEELVGGALPAENPSSARAILAPVLLAVGRTSDAPPVSSQPLSDRELLFELDKPDTAPPPALKKRKPSFFDIGDAPASRSHLFDAAPAPFDPHVPALPGRLNLQDDDENNPDSGLLDIRRLAARESEKKKKKKDAARASEDIFNLTGGLFAGSASAPLVAPDLNALIAPVVSESSRPSAPSRARTSAVPGERISGAPVAAVQARQRTLAAPVASPLRARAGWAAAIVIVGVVLVLVFLGMSSSSTTVTTVTTAETATPVVAVETAKPAPAPPIATTPPAASPEPPVAARDPGAPAKLEKDPVAATPATSTPRATAAPSPVGAGAAPVAAAPVVAAPVVAPPPPPPPPVAAEFNKSAAISALAAAAGRAAGCKQADGPSGGATVSITFAPSGRVTSSKVTGPPFQGTAVGGCIASAFRSASVPPFEGSPVSVTKTVSVR
ncbi:MAG: hypothetical protein ABI134_06550 [Byssovorax sp.]